jgi:pSer/pThr/pTyr-binding forkhead associated (FHA) protein
MDVKMLIVRGQTRGKFLRFPPGEFVFGRGPECHIRPNSPWVSRQHCLLRIAKEGVHVRDLGSSNGTLINGTRLVGERRMQPGDQLQVGPLVLQLVVDPTPIPGPAPAELATGQTTVLNQEDTTRLKSMPFHST